MLKRLTAWFLPVSAETDQPALRMILGSAAQTSRRQWVWHLLGAIVYVAALVIVGMVLTAPNANLNDIATFMLIPAFFAHFIISLRGFSRGMLVISDQRGRGTWDMLRVTAGGTRQTIRAAWTATVFYHLSGGFGVLIYAPRLFLLGLLLVDLASFRGEHLDYIVGGATPAVPWALGIPLFAVMLTAVFLLPLTAVGVEVAVGLLLSTFVSSRVSVTLTQVMLTVARSAWGLAATLVLFLMGTGISVVADSYNQIWVIIGAIALGDWGFSLLNIAPLEKLWRNVPYMAYSGVGLLAVIFLQMLITEGLLAWAARRAQRLE